MNRLKYKRFEEVFNLLCGKKLGEGAFRKVYECRIRSDFVVKVEKGRKGERWRTFANVREMDFWVCNAECKAIARWLAPCYDLSPDGVILLQQRAQPIADPAQLPARLPAFLTDLRAANFGVIDGRVVCIDYGATINNPPTKLRKAHWL